MILTISIISNVILFTILLWCVVKWPTTLTITNIQGTRKQPVWDDKVFATLLFEEVK